MLITVLAIRKSTAKRGSIKRIVVGELLRPNYYAHLKALIAVLIVEGPDPKPLNALIAVLIVDVKKTTGDFVKILVDQYDGFTKDVFHCLLPSMSRARSPATSCLRGPLAKQL